MAKQLRSCLRRLGSSRFLRTGPVRHGSSQDREDNIQSSTTLPLSQWKNKARHIMAVQTSGTPSTSRKVQSSESVSRSVVNPMTYASSGSSDESDSTFMDSGEYCNVCYATDHATTQCRHIDDPNKFLVSSNRNY